jgi:hypothetical protein
MLLPRGKKRASHQLVDAISTALSHNETILSHLYVAKRDTPGLCHRPHDEFFGKIPKVCGQWHPELLFQSRRMVLSLPFSNPSSVGRRLQAERERLHCTGLATPILQHFRYSWTISEDGRGFRNKQNPLDFCRTMEEFPEKHLSPRHERSGRRDRDDRPAGEYSTRQHWPGTR